jgi:Tfp pilus assembly protein PilE
MKNQRGQTLVATLIVIVIMCVLGVVLLQGSGAFSKDGPKSSRADGLGKTTVSSVKYAAKDDVCRSNLNQVRSSITINTSTDDEYPATIEDTRLGSSFYECPIGHEKYLYDPSSGKVSCPHAGHESY